MKICPVCSREYPSECTNCPDDGVALVALNTGATSRPEELVGKTVDGRYRIERIIGKGGMGTVYACRHVVVAKTFAMKVLKAGVERSEGVLQRFIREAQTANLLKSRHIVEMSDFGQLPNGSFFVVMELLEGEDLTRAMRSGRLSRGDLLHVFSQVSEALAVAHEKGIVHRDLKPDNVFLVREAGDPLFVKLLDFGIAKILHGESTGLTETGVILGTPYYMSPEQARAEPVDHRTDVYALGVMMYRAFTGKLPFVADSTMGVLTRHLTEAPAPPSQITKIDVDVERIILKCLEKLPAARFQSMGELGDAIRAAMHPRPGLREEATSDQRNLATSSSRDLYAQLERDARAVPTPTPMPLSGSMPRMQHVSGVSHVSGMAPPIGGEPTGRGFATTSSHTLSRGSSSWKIIGAFAMVGAGAAAAFGVYGRLHAGDVAGGASASPSSPLVTAEPAAAAQAPLAPPSAAQPPAAAPSASPSSAATDVADALPSPSASASAKASAARGRPRVAAPPPPPPTPTEPPKKHLPSEIRNPFD